MAEPFLSEIRIMLPLRGILGLVWVLAVSAFMLAGRAYFAPLGPRA